MIDSKKPVTYVSYLRVSTHRQGMSGLGLEAQRMAISRFVEAHGGAVLREFVEMESGKNNKRPELAEALALCRQKRAVLLIAKLDRLARNVRFVAEIMESGAKFTAVDQPIADPFMLHVQAAFAEEEARRISQRTKEALAAAKRRGVVIGATGAARAVVLKTQAKELAESFRPIIAEMAIGGARTTKDFRDALNARGVPSPGGGRWHLPNTYRLLHRLSLTRQAAKAAALSPKCLSSALLTGKEG